MKVAMTTKVWFQGDSVLGEDEPVGIENSDTNEVAIYIGAGQVDRYSIYLDAVTAAVVGMELIAAANKAAGIDG